MSLSRSLLLISSLAVLSTSACVVRAYPAYPGVPVNAEIITEAPPAARMEVVGVAPSPNHLWINGHWAWRGRWVWEPGFWEVRRPGAVWIEGHWVRHRHGWVWIGGHW